MDSAPVMRRVDRLGRVALPNRIRRQLGIAGHDPLEIWVNGEAIILQRLTVRCLFCGRGAGVRQQEGVVLGGKFVCRSCIEQARRESGGGRPRAEIGVRRRDGE
jgi:transcriptional pleiotropic regulator of transition state genes